MLHQLHKLNCETLSVGVSKRLPGHLLEGVHSQPTNPNVFRISVVGIGVSFLGRVSKVDLGTSNEGVAEEDKLAGVANGHLEGSGNSLQPGVVAFTEKGFSSKLVGKRLGRNALQRLAGTVRPVVNLHLGSGRVVEEENQGT